MPEFTALESGGLTPPVEMAIDARAVFDALTAQDASEPSESSLKLHVLAFRDRLFRGVCSILWWTDTRDMVADGLTKGGVDRRILTSVMGGTLTLMYPCLKKPVTPLRKRIGVNSNAQRSSPCETPCERLRTFEHCHRTDNEASIDHRRAAQNCSHH